MYTYDFTSQPIPNIESKDSHVKTRRRPAYGAYVLNLVHVLVNFVYSLSSTCILVYYCSSTWYLNFCNKLWIPLQIESIVSQSWKESPGWLSGTSLSLSKTAKLCSSRKPSNGYRQEGKCVPLVCMCLQHTVILPSCALSFLCPETGIG